MMVSTEFLNLHIILECLQATTNSSQTIRREQHFELFQNFEELYFYKGQCQMVVSMLRQAQQPQAQRPENAFEYSVVEPVETTAFVSPSLWSF